MPFTPTFRYLWIMEARRLGCCEHWIVFNCPPSDSTTEVYPLHSFYDGEPLDMRDECIFCHPELMSSDYHDLTCPPAFPPPPSLPEVK